MLSILRVSFPSPNDLEALITIRAAFQLELARRAQDRADADRRRDLVPYAEVLAEFGKEIADREARPPGSPCARPSATVSNPDRSP